MIRQSACLEYESSSELLHISAKQLNECGTYQPNSGLGSQAVGLERFLSCSRFARASHLTHPPGPHLATLSTASGTQVPLPTVFKNQPLFPEIQGQINDFFLQDFSLKSKIKDFPLKSKAFYLIAKARLEPRAYLLRMGSLQRDAPCSSMPSPRKGLRFGF